MNSIIAFISILFITGVGYTVIRGFGFLSKKDTLVAFGCSFGLGIGLITMQMYLYSRLNIPWQKPLLIIPWLLLAAVVLFKNKNKLHVKVPKIPKLHSIELILLFCILFVFGYTVFEALLRPVSAWDSWVTWLLKSKVFFYDGRINPDVFDYIRVNYPLVINLLGTFVYIMIGNVDDTAVLLTSSAFYAFTALLFFAVLKKDYGVRYALLFTFLLVTTQNFIRHGGRYEAGLADLPLGYYSFCSVILLREYFKKSSAKIFLLLNIFLGITGLIKHEGIPIGIAIELCALYFIYKKKLYKHLPIILFWIIPIVDSNMFLKRHNLKDDYFSSHVFEVSIKKTMNAFWGTIKELLNIKSWNFLWIVYFYLLITYRKFNKELLILNFIILSQLAIYMLLYLFTVGNNPESSIERLLMHIAPIAYYYIAINTKAIVKGNFGIISSNETKRPQR